MTTIKRTWNWIADEPHRLVGLRALHVAIGLLVLFRVFTEGRFALYLYGPEGLGEGSAINVLGASFGGVADLVFQTSAGTLAVFVALALGALGLILGYRTRLAALVTLIPFFLLEQRLPEVGDGGDNITRLALMFLIFALPARSRPLRGSLPVWLHNLSIAAISTQLCILYETSGIMKVMGDKWQHGTALYYISQVEWFSHPAFREMFKHPLVVTAASYLPMAFLVFFPLALLTRLKLPWIAIGIMFHTGIAISMGLVTFATVMIGLELFMISDEEYRWLGRALRTSLERLRAVTRTRLRIEEPSIALFIDGFCPHCVATGETLRRIDLRGVVRVVSFRHDDEFERWGLSAERLERRMQAVELASGRLAEGFDAVRLLARELVVLWPLRPVLALIERSGRGQAAYDWLASRRRIVPDPEACRGTCPIPAAVAEEARS